MVYVGGGFFGLICGCVAWGVLARLGISGVDVWSLCLWLIVILRFGG